MRNLNNKGISLTEFSILTVILLIILSIIIFYMILKLAIKNAIKEAIKETQNDDQRFKITKSAVRDGIIEAQKEIWKLQNQNPPKE